jgi:hypothetical protein
MNKTIKITNNDTTLNLTFRVASFQVHKLLRDIEKKYTQLLSIIDKQLDFSKFDFSDLTKAEIVNLNNTDNFATALEVITKLIPKNPEIMKIITNDDLDIDLREQKDKFYLEVFVLAIDVTNLEKEIADNFNAIDIFENEFLTNLDMAEVVYAVQQFRRFCK